MLPRMATLAQSRALALVRAIGVRSRADDVSTHAAAREVAQQRVRAAMTLRGQIPVGAR